MYCFTVKCVLDAFKMLENNFIYAFKMLKASLFMH